jgi:hypothetical protein
MNLRIVLIAAAVVAMGGAVVAQEREVARDRACVLECRHLHTRCANAARSEARMCVNECSDLFRKAREICAEAPGSDECVRARAESAACLQDCREALGMSLRECRVDAKECVALCPDAEPVTPADPICLGECRRKTSACLGRVNAAARECAEPCADLIATAKRACEAAPRSEECSLARREATSCLQPCREQKAAQTRECIASGQSCAASCPPPIVSTPDTGR